MHFVINIFIGQKGAKLPLHRNIIEVSSQWPLRRSFDYMQVKCEAPSGRVDKSQGKAASCEAQTHCACMCESVCQRLMGFYGLLRMAGSQKLLPMKL